MVATFVECFLINASVISSTKINQWKNTASVLKWFNSLNNKSSLSFICFDVCEFYPSITEKLLSKALNFASEHRQITSQEREIIHCVCRKNFSYYADQKCQLSTAEMNLYRVADMLGNFY